MAAEMAAVESRNLSVALGEHSRSAFSLVVQVESLAHDSGLWGFTNLALGIEFSDLRGAVASDEMAFVRIELAAVELSTRKRVRLARVSYWLN